MPEKNPKENENNTIPTIKNAVIRFVSQLQGLKRTELVSMPALHMLYKKASKKLNDFIKENNISFENEGDTTVTYSIPIEHASEFNKLKKNDSYNSVAFREMPKALIVSLISRYDAYLGELLRSLFYLKPELLNTSERSLTLQQLLKFPSIEVARDYIIEKEVESVIRESHVKQFDWMEKRFNIKLRNGLECWKTFVETTERRNLFVHCDGVVSQQYLDNCSGQNVCLDKTCCGDKLLVTAEYFNNAYMCIFEIGVKLSQVLWRKLLPNELNNADTALNEICFDLLLDEHYDLARRLLIFATQTLKKHSSNWYKKCFIINLAIAEKWNNSEKNHIETLDSEDWSDAADEFQLALAVLKDQFDVASNIVRRIGNEHSRVNPLSYELWPLFRDFRKSEEFLSAYKDIFGAKFHIEEKQESEKAFLATVPTKEEA